MKPLALQDLYELLEVRRDASETEIVRAWERAEALYGPGSLATYTLVSSDEAALLGRRLEESLAVLLDPEARRAYDASLGGFGSRGSTGSAPAPIPILLSRVVRSPGPLLPEPVTLAAAPEPPPAPAPAPAPATAAPSAPAMATPPITTPSAPARGLPFLDEGQRFTGELLRRSREARGLSAEEMCARTRIPRHHLDSLEADQRERLPAAAYLRGYLVAIARELRLDGQRVARSYLQPPPDGGEAARPGGRVR